MPSVVQSVQRPEGNDVGTVRDDDAGEDLLTLSPGDDHASGETGFGQSAARHTVQAPPSPGLFQISSCDGPPQGIWHASQIVVDESVAVIVWSSVEGLLGPTCVGYRMDRQLHGFIRSVFPCLFLLCQPELNLIGQAVLRR